MINQAITDESLKKLLLEKTNQGRDYFESVIPDLVKKTDKLYVTDKNPILKQDGEFTVQFLNGKWHFYYKIDRSEDVGDMFIFCARLHGFDWRKDIVKICAIIDEELELGLHPTSEIKVKLEEIETIEGLPGVQGSGNLLPLIPVAVYKTLPEFLKQLLDLFADKQDKDLLLLSLIIVFSGCFPKVYGTYNRKHVNLNLYLMIVGPASAGKSVARWARAVLEKVEEDYQTRRKMLFFPADTSFAALIENLAKNDGKGVIFAFEADSLTQNFAKEWGNTTALLRQAYEHERYENMRKSEKGAEAINILRNPALSILLTGTPNQVATLINDTEDGLFSRFCFYSIAMDPAWKSAFPEDDDVSKTSSINELLTPFKDQAYSIINTYIGQATEIKFDLTRNQKRRLDEHFAWLSAKHKDQVKTNAIATIRRMGLICFRIAGILTVIREYEQPGNVLTCTDEDFETAIKLSDVFIRHAFDIARTLPSTRYIMHNEQKRRFLQALPREFTRQEAIEVGRSLDIKENTIERYLTDLQPGFLTKLKHGVYQKVP